MKKRLGIILSALLLAMSANAADPELDNDINVDGLFNPSPTVAVKSFDTSEISPAVNLLTGTKDAYNFESEDIFDYFYNGDYGSAAQYVYTTATDENKGKSLAVVLDTDEYAKNHDIDDVYVYSSIAADFTETIDRPVALYFESYGTKQIGFWLNGGSTHTYLGQLSSSGWHKISADNTAVFNGTMKKVRMQYATRPSDCSDVQYYDNLAVYPFYKITYNAEYPDGTMGNDTVKYFFDCSALSVADDGTVTGLPESYTVENTDIEFFGYTIAGWSTKKDAASAMEEIPLNGEDIELYPIWKEAEKLTVPDKFFIPGKNAFTGNTTALNFNASSHIKFFENTQGTDKEMFSYDIVSDPLSSGKGNMLRVTMDTEKFLAKYDSATYTYHTIGARLESTAKRPGLLIYDTYGRGTVGFWLGAGTTFRNLGTLPGSASWVHVVQNNVGVFNGTMSSLFIQYGINDKNCDNVQYFDNLAFIPYYKATYVVNYPDGGAAEPVEKWFLATNSDITTANDGTLNGLPTTYSPEDIGISFPGYDLAGWTTEKDGKTAMTNIPLNNEDITVYPVWEKKAEQIPVTLTVYFDEEKKVSETHNLFAGDSFTLPGYYDLAEYTPEGMMPKGFILNGKLYAPGKTFNLPEVSELTAEALYENASSVEYGDLVFLENFESINNGTYICNPDDGSVQNTAVSYINPAWSENTEHFSITRGDTMNYLVVTDDGKGNNVLKIQKADAAQVWPQFCIYNNGTSPNGYYTIVADVLVPGSEAGKISNFNTRIFHTSSSYVGNALNTPATDAASWKNLTVAIPVEAGTAYEALYKFQIYITAPSDYNNSFCYVDNIALYVKNDMLEIKVSDEKTSKIFFIVGETVKFPYAHEIYEYIPDGYTLTGFTDGSKTFAPGESFNTTASDNGKVFEAVYEKTEYSLKFDLGNANGTVPEIPVKDGETVTLPKASGVIGWKAYGSDDVIKPGDSFTFVRKDELVNLDGVNRLVFIPIYEKAPENTVSFSYNYKLTDGMFAGATETELAYIKLAYGAGIIPASDTFDADASVTVNDLVKLAERLYYRSFGKASDFLTDDARLADMVEKGICESYENLDKTATNADVAIVLANALPGSYYTELAFDVKVTGLEKGDKGYAEALKLIRAGILPESTDFSEEITYGSLVEAIAKLVQPSERVTENKRTLYILGDSLTAKTGTIGWPTKIEPLLDGNLAVVNHGIGGINTGTYLSAYSEGYPLYMDMLQKIKPGDYVVIALGTNDSTLWGWGDMEYETSRDNYLKYIRQIRSEGGIPILVCPVGRNNTDENGVYVESDPLIIECMNDVNELYGVNAPIVNFKDVSFERLGAMTATERESFYADSVHYKTAGAKIVAGWFGELVSASTHVKLDGLASHFNEVSFDYETEENLYSVVLPTMDNVASVRTVAPLGIRFRAIISNAIREITDDVVEYGFIIARDDVLAGRELTHETGAKYVTGTSYNNALDVDITYAINGDDITFTCVPVDLPETKAAYKTNLAIRGYVKVGCTYYYGNTYVDSYYEAAKRLDDGANDFIKGIIELCEQ